MPESGRDPLTVRISVVYFDRTHLFYLFPEQLPLLAGRQDIWRAVQWLCNNRPRFGAMAIKAGQFYEVLHSLKCAYMHSVLAFPPPDVFGAMMRLFPDDPHSEPLPPVVPCDVDSAAALQYSTRHKELSKTFQSFLVRTRPLEVQLP